MEAQDEKVVTDLREATAALNKALEAAANQGIEVTPEFTNATSMEHSAPMLVLSIELTKHLGVV